MKPFTYPIIRDAFAPEDAHPATNELYGLTRSPDPWNYRLDDIRELQLRSINERLQERVEQIPALAQRVEQVGVDAVESLDDVVPLLFSPDHYKSYPEVLVTKGRWPQLARWLDGVSAHRIPEIDFDGVADLDDFLIRLEDGGHRVVTTSGTTGKTAMLPVSPLDVDRAKEALVHGYGAMFEVDFEPKRPLFYTGNRSGSYNGLILLAGLSEALSTPELTFTLFQERLRVADLSRIAVLNRKMASGTATPSDIVSLQEEQKIAAERADSSMHRFLDELVAHTDVPVCLWGQPFAFYTLMKTAKQRNLDVKFLDGSAIVMAGGLKNNKLPEGHQAELAEFYPTPIRTGYGQSEITAIYAECAAGACHVPPSIVPVVTDEQHEVVLNQRSGVVEGMLSHFDIALDGRWGGITTSDWVTLNFSPCPCGLQSPSVTSCRRLTATQDDKISCSGRIEMYVRGVVEES